ncbi:hypothetical protein FDP41_001042 [Naegleria fowleri]|uniref:ZZ-type domain-containing protein n=1 Tax=Naegleria fowleri TaxID=5763 RepID=A0A6A5C3L4_NAEFO|nr:uncharacterized protein FDP41_001042 [Naegleria fowleri]KAF0979889.1 hypothetical protein FDP41_001042 [Naegleria fowleri]CAG4717086.1 unnamed protein product [Naegleria fowleri]
MIDPRPRPLRNFLLLFADPCTESSSSSSPNNNQHLIKFQAKDLAWVQDGIGYKTLFLRILSFLDQYDLAQSIQPVCKLFQNFANCDLLWEQLFWNLFTQDFGLTKEETQKYLNPSNLDTMVGIYTEQSLIPENSWKFKVVNGVRLYYLEGHPSRDYASDTPGEAGIWRLDCSQCGAPFHHREPYIEEADSGDCLHLDCVDKEEFNEKIEHFAQIYGYISHFSRNEIISTFFKRRFIHSNKGEDDISDESVAEYTCDACGEPIHTIRYSCLDCEFDLCGYCCERLVYHQKGVDMAFCKGVEHPHNHTFLTVGEEYFDTYSCNVCKEKIRGFRYHDPTKDNFDLCTLCFKTKREANIDYDKIDLHGEIVTESFYQFLCNKMHLQELKDVYKNVFDMTVKGVKSQLVEELLELLEEKKEKNTRPRLCTLVSNVPRFCCKDDECHVLKEDAIDALVASLDLVEKEQVKPPKKKSKKEAIVNDEE